MLTVEEYAAVLLVSELVIFFNKKNEDTDDFYRVNTLDDLVWKQLFESYKLGWMHKNVAEAAITKVKVAAFKRKKKFSVVTEKKKKNTEVGEDEQNGSTAEFISKDTVRTENGNA